jgi:hypothetical protein
LSPEIEAFLAANNLDLGELVRSRGVDVRKRLGSDPANPSGGEKELLTVLVGSAVLIATITPILVEVIQQLSGRSAVVVERHLRAVEDSSGNVVRDKDSQPILHWVEVPRLIEPSRRPPDIQIKALGMQISFGSRRT